jgi:subtilisin family serine protease
MGSKRSGEMEFTTMQGSAAISVFGKAIVSEKVDYGHSLVSVDTMWSRGFYGKGVKVAVLDTGIDHSHPEFAGKNIVFKDFTKKDGDAQDRQGHGTHVAGIVAAPRNGMGLIGVAPDCDLYVAKVLSDNGTGNYGWIVKALEWCIENRVDVINMSLGGPMAEIPALRRVIQKAYALGIVLVAAAGNEGVNDGGKTNTIGVPAAYPQCWAVGSVDRYRRHSSFSSEGYQLDVCLPGQEVLSTYTGGRYSKDSGTSMAAPYFSGCLALIIEEFRSSKGRNPNQSEIKEIVVDKCVDLGLPGFNGQYGYGLFCFSHDNTDMVKFVEDANRINA